jgi:hypothetical protein
LLSEEETESMLVADMWQEASASTRRTGRRSGGLEYRGRLQAPSCGKRKQTAWCRQLKKLEVGCGLESGGDQDDGRRDGEFEYGGA